MQVNFYHVQDDVKFYCDKCGKETPVKNIHEFHFHRDLEHVVVHLCDECCKGITCAELLEMPSTTFTSKHVYDSEDEGSKKDEENKGTSTDE